MASFLRFWVLDTQGHKRIGLQTRNTRFILSLLVYFSFPSTLFGLLSFLIFRARERPPEVQLRLYTKSENSNVVNQACCQRTRVIYSYFSEYSCLKFLIRCVGFLRFWHLSTPRSKHHLQGEGETQGANAYTQCNTYTRISGICQHISCRNL